MSILVAEKTENPLQVYQ